MATHSDRLDLRLDASDKQELALAASLMSTPVSAFVREAARERARQVIAQSTRVTLSAEESEHFLDVFDAPFAPNPKLQRALERSRRVAR
ncbi:DUF1778 domain-containing protein [Cognatilysobacter terrigena]|uniref:type II toxin-antitoxin system TacA family antitoxin n=1 Tax=Cognatilysobacter terrigena TaxID=2488749 RepID=UPI00105B263D|nr:DUF1778 domain-containing protein [Lysobacter terrigena]